MATQSKIEWTDRTWNPTVGCTKISPGCKNCYALGMAERLKAMGIDAYRSGFKLRILEERFRIVDLRADDLRIDFVGLNAIHGEASPADALEPYEVAVRVAARTAAWPVAAARAGWERTG